MNRSDMVRADVTFSAALVRSQSDLRPTEGGKHNSSCPGHCLPTVKQVPALKRSNEVPVLIVNLQSNAIRSSQVSCQLREEAPATPGQFEDTILSI